MELDGKRIKMQIWDTPHQNRFRTITEAYYRRVSGLLLVYDITNEESFQIIPDLITQAQEAADPGLKMILVGNRCEQDTKRVVSTEHGQALADQHEIPFFEVSARNDINITEVFTRLLMDIIGSMTLLSSRLDGHIDVDHEVKDGQNKTNRCF